MMTCSGPSGFHFQIKVKPVQLFYLFILLTNIFVILLNICKKKKICFILFFFFNQVIKVMDLIEGCGSSHSNKSNRTLSV